MEYEVYVDERRSGKLQMARMQWYADYNDPTSWLKMYQTGNAQNDVNWSNADYDKLIEESDKILMRQVVRNSFLQQKRFWFRMIQ